MTHSRICTPLSMLAVILTATALIGGCASDQAQLDLDHVSHEADKQQPGTVLPSNMRLQAKTPDGEVSVEAGHFPLRVLSWDDRRQGAITKADKSRKGMSFSGRPEIWEDHHDLTRLSYYEGLKDFDSEREAAEWLQEQGRQMVYNRSGLALKWLPKDDTLYIEVLRITVDGDTPAELEGASDNMELRSLSDEEQEDRRSWFQRYISGPLDSALSW